MFRERYYSELVSSARAGSRSISGAAPVVPMLAVADVPRPGVVRAAGAEKIPDGRLGACPEPGPMMTLTLPMPLAQERIRVI